MTLIAAYGLKEIKDKEARIVQEMSHPCKVNISLGLCQPASRVIK